MTGAKYYRISAVIAGIFSVFCAPASGVGWKYSRDIQVAGNINGESLAEIVLTPDILSKCRPGLPDLGLFDRDGRELPYVIQDRKPGSLIRVYPGDLVENRETGGRRSVWTVDLGGEKYFDRIIADISSGTYLKPVTVETSHDMARWRMARKKAVLYSSVGRISGRFNVISMNEPKTARYIRITGDDSSSTPVSPGGFRAEASDSISGLRWEREAMYKREKSKIAGKYVYRLVLKPNESFDRVIIQLSARRYIYPVAVYEGTAFNDPRIIAQRESPPPGLVLDEAFFSPDEEPDQGILWLGGGSILKANAGNSSIQVKSSGIDVAPKGNGVVWVEISGREGVPLEGLVISVSGISPRLLFTPTGAPLKLKYGNDEIESRERPVNMIGSRVNDDADIMAVKTGREHRIR